MSLSLHATLCPSFPHFNLFANDSRLAGIRFNSAMTDNSELETELGLIQENTPVNPLWFDVKGRQLRITNVHFNDEYLDISINHRISVPTPVPVLFKAGADRALLARVEEDGRRLIFDGGPEFLVKAGESLHIRHSKLKVLEEAKDMFTPAEKEKIERVRNFGFSRYYLSYVYSQRYVDEFRELVGPDAEVRLKIEDIAGLKYVDREFIKNDNTTLVAARGDLYVELNYLRHILPALKLIISKDPKASVGSRILLSVFQPPLAKIKRALNYVEGHQPDEHKAAEILDYLMEPQLPSCADFLELAWLYDIGYHDMMLCDEICLRGDLLNLAIDAFESFRKSYVEKKIF